MISITIGFDVVTENPLIVFQTDRKLFSCEMVRVHGNHPYPIGKMDKQSTYKLRDFLTEVIEDEKKQSLL